ncbi:MAG: cell wall-binding repeat-containing protein [Egibacteraceae bacterium]
MRRCLARCLPLAVVAALTLAPVTAPAGALSGTVTGASTTVDEHRIPVFPGLDRRHLSLRLDDGRPAVANVLEFQATDQSLELRPHLGQGRVPGVESVPAMGARLLPDGGVAGINGGFWLSNPVGDPNGFFAVDHLLQSEAQTQGGGPRGTVASLPDGQLIMDRLASNQDVAVGTASPVRLNGVNRYHADTPPAPDGNHASFVYTPAFGATVNVRALRDETATLPVRAFVVAGLAPRPSGSAQGTVSSVQVGEGSATIPAGGAVIVSHGDHATQFSGAAAGSSAVVRVGLQPEHTDGGLWGQIRHGLAAGPLIVRDGERTDPSTWETEGFSPGTHSDVRHPRSAIGRTADGRVLLVTVDGRRPGYSVGMTMHELAHLLRQMGAVDGLALDGGGSTQMVTDGALRNRACCDAALRPVATGLFVHHAYDFDASDRLAGASRAGTAAAIARESHPNGAQEVFLATQATFADALAGGPLAVRRNAPLLLTEQGDLPQETLLALAALRPTSVTLLGGSNAIGAGVQSRLASSYQVRRVAGRDRYATAAAIAEELGAGHPRAFLVVGGAFPDALSASGPAGMLGMPILLTSSDALPTSTLTALEEAGTTEVVVAGGAAAVGEGVVDELRREGYLVTRVFGPSRYATAARVNEWAQPQIPELDDSGLVVALGERFPDALAGGPLAAKRRQLLMIVPGTDVHRDPHASAFLADRAGRGLARVTLLGGHAALSSFQHWQLDQLAR